MLNARYQTLLTLSLLSLISFAGQPFDHQTIAMDAQPMMVDGDYLDAGEVLALQQSEPDRDVIRFYVYDKNAAADGMIYGFTNLYYFNQYLTATGRSPLTLEIAHGERDEANMLQTKGSGMVLYFDNTDFVGPTGAMSSGTARCLENTDWWFNDRIESIWSLGCDCTWTILRQDCGPGSSFWIEGEENVADLGVYWNNTVSFIQVLN